MKLTHKIVKSYWVKKTWYFEAFTVTYIEIQNIKVTCGKNNRYEIQRTMKQYNSHSCGHLLTLFF